MSILKKREEAVNKALEEGRDEDVKSILSSLFSSQKKRSAPQIMVGGKKIEVSSIIKIFINSNLSLSGKVDEFIGSVVALKNHEFLNKLIKDDSEFFKTNQKNDLLHKLVIRDSIRSLLRLYMAGYKNLNQWNKKGETPLHCISLAEFNSQYTTCCFLLALGADPSIPDREGKLPSKRIKDHIDSGKDKLTSRQRSNFAKIAEIMDEYCKLKESQAQLSMGEGGPAISPRTGEGGPATSPRGAEGGVVLRLESREESREESRGPS